MLRWAERANHGSRALRVSEIELSRKAWRPPNRTVFRARGMAPMQKLHRLGSRLRPRRPQPSPPTPMQRSAGAWRRRREWVMGRADDSKQTRARAIAGRTALASHGLWLLVVVVALLVLGRVVQLQVAPRESLAWRVGGQWSERQLGTLRGSIVDRRGRVVALSYLGQRVFLDPERLESPPGVAVTRLAEALGMDEDEVGERVMAAMARGDARKQAIEAWKAKGSPEGESPGLVIRYVPFTDVLAPELVAAAREMARKTPGVHLEAQDVRRVAADDAAISLVGKTGRLKIGERARGLAGLEASLDERLQGEPGTVRFVRDHRGRPLWMGPDAWEAPEEATPIRLSIDLALQRMAVQELERGVRLADAAGGRVMMIDPRSGEVLAMADTLRPIEGLAEFPYVPREGEGGGRGPGPVEGVRYRTQLADPWREREPALARNRCVVDVYEPGSTLKPLIWAMLTEAGVMDPAEIIDTEGGVWRTPYGRRVEDVTRRDELSWADVLVHSSNIGMAKATSRVSHGALRRIVRSFGFGRTTGLGLGGEAPGIVTSEKQWTKYTQTSVSFGYEIAVTPAQMVRAFAAIAGDGWAPTLSVALDESGTLGVVERVFSPETARATREALVKVAARADEKMARGEHRVRGLWKDDTWRYSWFGKSGTAEIPVPPAPKGMRIPKGVKAYFDQQYTSSFIAAGPVEGAEVLVVVVIDDPGPKQVRDRQYYGSVVAAPVARRVLERSLRYLGVEPDRPGNDDRVLIGSLP